MVKRRSRLIHDLIHISTDLCGKNTYLYVIFNIPEQIDLHTNFD